MHNATTMQLVNRIAEWVRTEKTKITMILIIIITGERHYERIEVNDMNIATITAKTMDTMSSSFMRSKDSIILTRYMSII